MLLYLTSYLGPPLHPSCIAGRAVSAWRQAINRRGCAGHDGAAAHSAAAAGAGRKPGGRPRAGAPAAAFGACCGGHAAGAAAAAGLRRGAGRAGNDSLQASQHNSALL